MSTMELKLGSEIEYRHCDGKVRQGMIIVKMKKGNVWFKWNNKKWCLNDVISIAKQTGNFEIRVRSFSVRLGFEKRCFAVEW